MIDRRLTHVVQELVCAFGDVARICEAGRSWVLFADRGELRVDPPADLHEQNRRSTLNTHTQNIFFALYNASLLVIAELQS